MSQRTFNRCLIALGVFFFVALLLTGCATAPKPSPTICDYRIIGGAARSSMEAMQCVEDELVRWRSMARAARPVA